MFIIIVKMCAERKHRNVCNAYLVSSFINRIVTHPQTSCNNTWVFFLSFSSPSHSYFSFRFPPSTRIYSTFYLHSSVWSFIHSFTMSGCVSCKLVCAHVNQWFLKIAIFFSHPFLLKDLLSYSLPRGAARHTISLNNVLD